MPRGPRPVTSNFPLSRPARPRDKPLSPIKNQNNSPLRKELKSSDDNITAIITNNIVIDNGNILHTSSSDQTPLPIDNNIGTDRMDYDRENCLILCEKVEDKMVFSPPNKEWMTNRVMELKLVRTRNKLTNFKLESFGETREITVNTKPSSIRNIIPDGNCLFR
ncbi:unnamed protein product [Didymodactylos carnosus]|uniref:OTU domain-containing protein n=1 Tax=Didymodactylos carnosus TaxID=1234261 RepID=A0A8S2U232_9BILA|nr:unnamed protein product [Didymodactylos carnosus]CAF4316653.1 unnamed protein product [Didymodactylos carnosus]